jgi:cation transport regulator ChaC
LDVLNGKNIEYLLRLIEKLREVIGADRERELDEYAKEYEAP